MIDNTLTCESELVETDDWSTDDIAFVVLYTPLYYGGYCNFTGVVSHG